jgi:hypothetical protein
MVWIEGKKEEERCGEWEFNRVWDSTLTLTITFKITFETLFQTVSTTLSYARARSMQNTLSATADSVAHRTAKWGLGRAVSNRLCGAWEERKREEERGKRKEGWE